MSNPNMFIIGAPKCGTTALVAYLAEHPDIFICACKEPFFWSSDIPLPWGDQMNDLPRSMEEYMRLFAGATDHHLIIGEGSTTYLWSAVAVERILAFAPDAKFICMLRNPIDLARAMHTTEVYYFQEPVKDFETAWRLRSERLLSPDPRVRIRLDYRSIASLGTQLKRFMDRVPETQRHIILFDDFAADTQACYEGVLRFLGLPADGRTEFPVINAAGAHRSGRVAQFIMQPPKWAGGIVRLLRPILRRLGLRMIRHRLLSAFTRPQRRAPFRPEFHAELVNAFRDEIMLISQLLGRDLTYWMDVSNGKRVKPQTAASTPRN